MTYPALRDQFEVTGTHTSTLNLTWPTEKIEDVLESIFPDVIINTAALTTVDACESRFEEALQTNAYGPKALAEWCLKQNKYLIHISTDYVFDGTKGSPYEATDTPHPINHYGESKWAGETAVLGTLPQAAVVRTSWLFGPGGKNFVPFVIEKALSQTPVNIANDQWGTPTWTGNLCKMLLHTLEEQPCGILHGACQGVVSRYEQAKHLCQLLSVPDTFITPVPTAFFNFAAKRPVNTAMQPSFSSALPWQEATEQFIESQGLKRHA
jgi:dTDP-4-dehydrorhamnose reductase